MRLTVRATTSAPSGKPAVTTFVEMPDMPLSSLSMTLTGGRGGLLTLARSLCAGRHARRLSAAGALVGQNGARRSVRVRVRAAPVC